MEKKIAVTCRGADSLFVDQLEPFQGNLKNLSTENYNRLKKEILELGFSEPVSVWPHNGKFLLLNGHQRHRALTQMKSEGFEIPKIPVNYIEAKDVKEAKKKVLALTSQYGEMTSQGLYEFMNEAELTFAEIDESFRFPELDFKKFKDEFFEDPEPETDPDEVPNARPTTNIKLGDIFQLGDHRLMCGDSTKKENLDLLLNGESIDMVFTDPPYGISIVNLGAVGPRNAPSQMAKAREYRAIEGDNVPFDPRFILDLGIKTVILWGANHYASKLPDRPQWLIWDKKLESGSMDGNNFSDCELAWTNKTGLSAKIYRHVWAGMLREGDRKEELKDRVHPTQKPVGLSVRILNDFSNSGERILELYLGSGSTLIACEKTGRRCFGMEIDPVYCQVIIDRWEKYSGKKSVKV